MSLRIQQHPPHWLVNAHVTGHADAEANCPRSKQKNLKKDTRPDHLKPGFAAP
ncbi:hypothetical protein T484DRAFT_1822132 [Baffinella frigidus]|nr:hypothetical protein T484DRAFT_1822132 [Cryptophyta sp. CCMP2293]